MAATSESGAAMPDDLAGAYCEARREPLADYLANRAFVSSTQLRRFERIGLVASQLSNRGVDAGTAMGEALHALVLEPDVFARQYLVLEQIRSGKAVVSEEEMMRRQWLDAWQWSTLCHARDALLACRQFPLGQWLAAGEKELSIYWRDQSEAGWKARPDCFTPEIVCDLKTTNDCRPEAFKRSRERFGYDLQAAHYVEAVARLTGHAPRFAFASVELKPPYPVWIHELDEPDLAAARARLGRLRKGYLAASIAAGDSRRAMAR